jgi:hypothetical protein
VVLKISNDVRHANRELTHETVSDLGPAEVTVLFDGSVEELLVLWVAHALVYDDVVPGWRIRVSINC